MLAQRIATALVMLLVMVAVLMAPQHWPFALLMLAVLVAAAWEWGRLTGLKGTMAIAIGVVTATVLVAVWWWLGGGSMTSAVQAAVPPWVWWVASAGWAAGGALALRSGVGGWRQWPQSIRLLLGVVMLVVAWVAVTQAEQVGILFLLSAMMLIWASDIAAYFGGRAWGGRLFGGRKLAPSISPGKTWEGAVCGLVGAVALASVWVLLIDPRAQGWGASLFTRIVTSHGWLAMLVAVLALAAAGIMGDLFESLVKRAAGAKDSSRLLPGHGGVLDRIDALLPVLPMVMALLSLTQ